MCTSSIALRCSLFVNIQHIHSYIHTFIHSYIHTFIHSYIHTFILTPVQLSGHDCCDTARPDRALRRHRQLSPEAHALLYDFPARPGEHATSCALTTPQAHNAARTQRSTHTRYTHARYTHTRTISLPFSCLAHRWWLTRLSQKRFDAHDLPPEQFIITSTAYLPPLLRVTVNGIPVDITINRLNAIAASAVTCKLLGW